MSDKVIRHVVAILGMIVCLLAYWAGYIGGREGWWWTSFGVLAVYYILFHLIEA